MAIQRGRNKYDVANKIEDRGGTVLFSSRHAQTERRITEGKLSLPFLTNNNHRVPRTPDKEISVDPILGHPCVTP
jgi:hypothetical protein